MEPTRLIPVVLVGALAGALVGGCGARATQAPAAARSVDDELRADPAYDALASDAGARADFERYWTWLGGLGVPDVEYLDGLPADDLEALAMRYHEQVELRGWLALGHRLDDVVDVAYYQAHYAEVYPVAHAQAMTAELALLAGFAARRGFPPVPARAFVLVGPMIERRAVTPAMADRRLRFNPAVAAEAPTADELDVAARVYEAGGHHYRDRAAVVAAAVAAVSSVAPAGPPPAR